MRSIRQLFTFTFNKQGTQAMKTNNANYDIKVNGNSISFIDRATNGTVLKMEATLSSLSEARISEILLMVALTLNK